MKRTASIVSLFVLVLLFTGLTFSSLASGAAGQEPQPQPEKLDAVLARLAGLLATPTDQAQESEDEGTDSPYQPAQRESEMTDQLTHLAESEAGQEVVAVLMKTTGSLEGIKGLGVIVQSIVGTVVAARVPVGALPALTALPNVEFIEAAHRLETQNDLSVPHTNAPALHGLGFDGSGIIVGVIDTGVDFTHPDFRKPDGATRIKFLCDQTDPPRAGEGTCPGGGTATGGTLWTESQINAALRGEVTVRQQDTNGHGSHVLGSVASDDGTFGGMAPGADIIMVKTSFMTNDIVGAMGFIDQRAAALGMPYVTNMSLGGNFGPRDGTELDSQAINQLTGAGKPGKAIVVAAGNEGTLNMHASGTVVSPTALERALDVPTGTTFALVETWYSGSDTLCFNFRDPGGASLVDCVPPGNETPVLCSPAATCIQVIHSATQTRNNSRQVLFGIFGSMEGQPIGLPGTWRIVLSGSGHFDSWCNFGCQFLAPHGSNQMTMGTPALAHNAIAVGSFVTKDCWVAQAGTFCYNPRPTVGGISPFSSRGPTRDGRIKPDIAAPGQAVVSSLTTHGFEGCIGGATPSQLIAPDGKHVVCQGTSMASPHVAGAVALLLQQDPGLDAAQIKQALCDTAVQDGFTGSSANNTWGCGKMRLVAPPHVIDITDGPSGAPNPVESGGLVNMTVAATDSLGHDLSYSWTADCPGLPSSGSFNDDTLQSPTWTAPANTTGGLQECAISVEVTDGILEPVTGEYVQGVEPVHVIDITDGPSGVPNPVESGGTVNMTVAATDSLGHDLSYSWASDCPGLPSGGGFNDDTLQSPTWTAPANATGTLQECAISVEVTDGILEPVTGEYVQGIESEVVPPPCGDLDEDSRSNALDVVIVAQATVGAVELTEEQARQGDVTRDGSVNVFDGIKLLLGIVGLTEITGCGLET